MSIYGHSITLHIIYDNDFHLITPTSLNPGTRVGIIEQFCIRKDLAIQIQSVVVVDANIVLLKNTLWSKAFVVSICLIPTYIIALEQHDRSSGFEHILMPYIAV
jgi:hypothetical protein